MLKHCAVIAALVLAPMSSAFADNDAGCGVGTQVWKGQKGLLPKIMAATTNGSFFNTISMTFGVLGCSSDGVVTASNRLPMFAGTNLDQLSVEMAAGNGETLNSLAALYSVDVADRVAFNAMLQANYGAIFSNTEATAGEVLAAVETAMRTDTRFAAYLA